MSNSVVIQNLVKQVIFAAAFFGSCLFLVIANIVADSSALRE